MNVSTPRALLCLVWLFCQSNALAQDQTAPLTTVAANLRLGGVVAVIIAVSVVIILLLRSKLKHERLLAVERTQAGAAVREMNTTLELRVQQRTAELEAMQRELQRSLDQERELHELKSRFVTMVSHEFRTPLGIIMSAIELIRHYEERLPPAQKQELYDDIHRSTRLMAGLMEQVLVLGRAEAGRLYFKPAPLDLDTLARKLADETHSATNRTSQIEWRPEGDLAGAMGDEGLLRHIFTNLLSNAVKYSPAGEPVLFTARRDNQEVIFTVQDRGIGIPAADQARMFEAFHRGSNVGETPGTGLGLVIVKRCVELHGGSLTFASSPEGGTAFEVRLPLFAAGA